MKNSIYVGVNGAFLALTSGQHAIAIRPAGKGEQQSYALTEAGELISIKGQRINGFGVTRYITGLGFAPAKEGDAAAERLADKIAMREGVELVEKASRDRAKELQKSLSGLACTYVPFEAARPCEAIKVREDEHFTTTIFALGAGFWPSAVKGDYLPDEGFKCMEANLGEGWIVAPGVDPATMPRNSEYGGLIERAVFILENSGIGQIVGARQLAMDEDAPVDAPFPRGQMQLALAGSQDHLVIGIDAVDDLVVQYVRDDKVIFQRAGLDPNGNSLNIGTAIGAIAAALVRVSDMDTQGAKATHVKKAA